MTQQYAKISRTCPKATALKCMKRHHRISKHWHIRKTARDITSYIADCTVNVRTVNACTALWTESGFESTPACFIRLSMANM